jgi:G3E family GTPase
VNDDAGEEEEEESDDDDDEDFPDPDKKKKQDEEEEDNAEKTDDEPMEQDEEEESEEEEEEVKFDVEQAFNMVLRALRKRKKKLDKHKGQVEEEEYYVYQADLVHKVLKYEWSNVDDDREESHQKRIVRDVLRGLKNQIQATPRKDRVISWGERRRRHYFYLV